MSNETFATYVVDQLGGLGPVTVKRMFGGAGLYKGDVMFGIIDDARLFFRTSPDHAAAYESRGMKPFEPWAGHVMNGYREVPPDVLEDADSAREWAQRAVADAKALKKPKRAAKGRRR